MKVISTVSALREELRKHQPAAYVPTMGGLHEGHIALVELARQQAEVTVVSLFVNRLQFGPAEDFDQYPRTFESDLQKLEMAGASIVFTPTESDIYPEQQEFFVQPSAKLSTILEGEFRPDFFGGVATVVMKLLSCVQPGSAIFGKKDYQQLMIVRSMVKQFCLPVQIVAGETHRASDGLALASRNAYLSAQERQEAPCLYREISNIAQKISAGSRDFDFLERQAIKSLTKRGWIPEYVAIRNAADLQAPTLDSCAEQQPLVVLAAARLGMTRLIDNVEIL